jgi:hypothetical protein
MTPSRGAARASARRRTADRRPALHPRPISRGGPSFGPKPTTVNRPPFGSGSRGPGDGTRSPLRLTDSAPTPRSGRLAPPTSRRQPRHALGQGQSRGQTLDFVNVDGRESTRAGYRILCVSSFHETPCRKVAQPSAPSPPMRQRPRQAAPVAASLLTKRHSSCRREVSLLACYDSCVNGTLAFPRSSVSHE